VASDFETLCLDAQKALREYAGAFVESVTLVAAGTYDRLDIRLVDVPKKREVVLSLERIYYLQMTKPPQLSESFIDDLAVHYLPNDGRAWPSAADGLVTPFPGIPELVYISLVGPTSITAVASVLVIARSLSPSPGETA
jgi:hypothetical protein